MERILVALFRQESHSFVPGSTTMADFELGGIRRGNAVLKRAGNREIDGYLDSAEELNVELRTQGNVSFYTCMSPRGYADLSCGALGVLFGFTSTFSDTVRLQFWQNADSASVLILPMGQVVG